MLKGLREKLKWLDPFTYVDIFILPKIKGLDSGKQTLVFGFTYIFLLASVFLLLGGNFFVAFLLTALYAYLLFAERGNAVEWAVYIFSAFIFAFVLYNFVLSFLLGTNVPLVIVFSGSMEPTLYRGDVAILSGAGNVSVGSASVDFPVAGKSFSEIVEKTGYSANVLGIPRPASLIIGGKEYFLEKGPIVVYHSPSLGVDIIHRAVFRIDAPDGSFVLTMGDNVLTNNRIDQDCPQGANSCLSPAPVPVKELRGKYLFHIPLVGYAKLLIFDDLPAFLKSLS